LHEALTTLSNMLTQQNSKKQGDVGLGSAISYFTSKGLTVCIPLTDSQDYDLVVDLNGLKKIQVKTTTSKPRYDIFVVCLKVCGGNKSRSTIKKFDPSFVDFVFVLTNEGETYLLPSSICGSTAISLGKDKEKYKLIVGSLDFWES